MDEMIAEYQAFRNELQGIVRVRYIIFAAVIIGIGVITGLAANVVLTSTEASRLVVWIVPLGYTTLIAPATVMTYSLTVHYHRLDAHLWARTETTGSGLIFQRAYENLPKQPSAYSRPLIYTYLVLTFLCCTVSIMLPFPVGTTWYGPLMAALALAVWIIAWAFCMYKRASREQTRRFKREWEESLKKVEESR